MVPISDDIMIYSRKVGEDQIKLCLLLSLIRNDIFGEREINRRYKDCTLGRALSVAKKILDDRCIEYQKFEDLHARALNKGPGYWSYKEMCNHPFFWDEGRTLSFYVLISELLFSKDNGAVVMELCSQLTSLLHANQNSNWKSTLEKHFDKGFFGTHRYQDSPEGLIRLARNVLVHSRRNDFSKVMEDFEGDEWKFLFYLDQTFGLTCISYHSVKAKKTTLGAIAKKLLRVFGIQ